MDSEKIATNHVELAISKTGHLVSHINSNPVAAKIHFDKLPEESQKFFESCPIYHFMPNGQPTISALTEG